MERFSELLLSLYRASRERPLGEFQDVALSLAKSCLKFDSSMWGSATFGPNGLVIHNVHLHNEPEEMVSAYEGVKHKDAAMFELWRRKGGTLSVNAATRLSGKDKRDAREHTRRFKHENILLTCHVDRRQQLIQWISLYRADAQALYSERERRLAHMLRAHLLEALALNRLNHLKHLDGDGRKRGSLLALADKKGVLYHADEAFSDLLAREFRTAPTRRLPDALLESLAQRGQYKGREMVAESALQADLLFIRARARRAADGLSERELQVAYQVAQGRTYKEVAAALGIAPSTARNHMQAIYDKLGVKNKAGLVGELELSR